MTTCLNLPLPAKAAPFVLATVCLLAPGTAAPESQKDPLAAAWQATAASLFREAHTGFETQAGREADLGRALTLLQLQPKTEGNVNDAAALLARVLQGGADDELGINAQYFLGRINQVHRTPADPEAAALCYRRLIETHPRHPLAGQALVKLALIELYRVQPDEERARVFERFSGLASRQTDAGARRDLNLLLGETALRFKLGDSAALDRFLAASDAGILRPALQADTLVRIGELARRLHRYDLARSHYQRFLAAFPRDNRRRMIEDALAALPVPP